MPMLPIIKLGKKYYFKDERMGQLRNVKDPFDTESIELAYGNPLAKTFTTPGYAVADKKGIIVTKGGYPMLFETRAEGLKAKKDWKFVGGTVVKMSVDEPEEGF